MHFLNLHVFPVVYSKGLFLALYSFPYIFINYMSQAVRFNLFLYADDTCLVCQHKDINEIEKQLKTLKAFVTDLLIIS